MDGVLCEDPPRGYDRDETLYLKWIQSAKPYLIPAFEIDAIVTSRLEKYRPQTEAWLKKHDVQYKKLVMWDLDSKKDRNGRNADHKAGILTGLKPDIFWESSMEQSQKIRKATGIPCLCINEMTYLR